jgi:hypothetical protein
MNDLQICSFLSWIADDGAKLADVDRKEIEFRFHGVVFTVLSVDLKFRRKTVFAFPFGVSIKIT